jgi:hypothetical protein
VADRLLEALQQLDREHLADDHVLDVVAVGGDTLQLESGGGELLGDLVSGDRGEIDVLPQP